MNHGRVIALADVADGFDFVAELQRIVLLGLNFDAVIAVLQKHPAARIEINHCADDFDAMAVSGLRGELEQAADGARVDGEGILRRGDFDFQIVGAGDHQADGEELALMVELRGAHAAHAHGAVEQFLGALHGQGTGENEQAPAAGGDFNLVIR